MASAASSLRMPRDRFLSLRISEFPFVLPLHLME
jgi:hypothetical protein